MALGSCITCRSSRDNTLANPVWELDELVGQDPTRESNARSNEASIEAPTPPEAPTPLFVPPTSKDIFIKFMKVFIETTQARD